MLTNVICLVANKEWGGRGEEEKELRPEANETNFVLVFESQEHHFDFIKRY